ncbi:MAG: hypothetical protein L6R40_006896 [Gallowayella cf. fulva]|nr:MAG: hypothetical protein L6R40_006896 [Xanthomendoza cf. fulva]
MAKRKRQQEYHTKRMKAVQEGSNEEVLLADIRTLLENGKVGEGKVQGDGLIASKVDAPLERFSEVEVKISALSSIGDGLGFSSVPDHVFVVPFTLPGDIVKAKVVTQFADDFYTLTDLVSVLHPSPQRRDDLVKCRYFAKCSGCQFQMLSYKDQLAHKKTILEKAYRNFSNLPPEKIPVIGDTIGSPLQYGYRTKLTPHFDGPPGSRTRKGRKDGSERPGFENVPPIGFMVKGTRKTMDIEDCPIATNAVRDGLKKERKRVVEELSKYRRGATILLRETTTRTPVQEQSPSNSAPPDGTNPLSSSTDLIQVPSNPAYNETKTYITDQNATSTEHIGPYTFLNPAGAFFQNNNSILQPFTDYIRSHILPPSPPLTLDPTTQPTTQTPPKTQIKNLIDAYSGSGLFSITLSPLFARTLGIDISPSSIASATANAILNHVHDTATFTTGDAANIFAAAQQTLNNDESVVVIDPPRKGCDEGFLRQLLGFAPKRVCYVSCNVHTQARDVGVLVRGGKEAWWEEDGGKGSAESEREGEEEVVGNGEGGEIERGGEVVGTRKGRVRYRIESLRGFDFFPQTGHVEGVAMLHRVDSNDAECLEIDG